jgi:hypothetical protein
MKFPFSFRTKAPADKLPEQTPQQHPEQKPATPTVADATALRSQADPVSQSPQGSDTVATTNAVPTQLQASPSPQAVAPQAPVAPAAPVAPVASAATSTPAASTTTPVVGQMDSMVMSAEDIIAAYKIFLKRVPESMEVVTPRVGLSAERVLFDFMSSSELTSRPEVANLVFAVGKKILDERAAKNPASAPTDAPTVSTDQTPTPTTDTNLKSS